MSDKKKKSRFFETYISKLINVHFRNKSITTSAKQQLNNFLCTVARQICDRCERMTILSKKKTISFQEVSSAVSTLFPPTLAENSVKFSNQSAVTFISKRDDTGSRQNKAELIFPPCVAEKFLRRFGMSKFKISECAPVALAATLEYITADLLEIASHISTDDNRVRITVRDLTLSSQNDPEISQLFRDLNVCFLGGGVIPYIHPSLLPKPEEKTDKKKRKVGTSAIREIEKYQKVSNCLFFPRYPFEKYVREIIGENKQVTKISRDMFVILQHYVEQFIVSLLQKANKAAIHSNRVKLMPQDLKFICDLDSISYDTDETVESDDNITMEIGVVHPEEEEKKSTNSV